MNLLTSGQVFAPASAGRLHCDGVPPVRAITSAAGVKIENALTKPFGEQSEWLLPGTPAPETKGWIGERFDADAGLQYLNARYYDPELSLFLQPDWFEVTKAGVGTNRFSYSFNDPVNKLDPGGNETQADDGSSWPDKDDPDPCERRGGCRLQDAIDSGLLAAWDDPVGTAGSIAYELSPIGAIGNIYTGLRDGNYKQAALGVAEITPWGKLAGKVAKAVPSSAGSVDDLLANGVDVVGKPQFTRGAGGMDHAAASVKAALEEVNRLGGPQAVDKVYFDTQLGKIVDGVTSQCRPDCAIRARDGSLSLIEVASPSQTVAGMRAKINRMADMIRAANPGISVDGWSKTVSDILQGL